MEVRQVVGEFRWSGVGVGTEEVEGESNGVDSQE